jgi:hypothetical protein
MESIYPSLLARSFHFVRGPCRSLHQNQDNCILLFFLLIKKLDVYQQKIFTAADLIMQNLRSNSVNILV